LGAGTDGTAPTQIPQATEFAEHRHSHRPDPVEAMTDQLEYKAAVCIETLMEPVRRLVDNAASFDEVLGGLADLYPDMDDTTFKALLGEAMMAAHMAGAAVAKERIQRKHNA